MPLTLKDVKKLNEPYRKKVPYREGYVLLILDDEDGRIKEFISLKNGHLLDDLRCKLRMDPNEAWKTIKKYREEKSNGKKIK